jgi:hypothetical protein
MDANSPESVGHPKRIQIQGMAEPDAHTARFIAALRDLLADEYNIVQISAPR